MEGMLIRCGCYVLSFVLIYLLMLVLPAEKKAYSYIGERTMAVYIFHGLVYSCLKYATPVLASVRSNTESILLILFCLALVWIASRKPFVFVTDKVSHLL